ncbi:patched domain-containing protein 3-like [Centruroides sculpturatus]|uniref:patched domain-containing protein 3-like n=2 Tax=Centruroides sculpturatus TaxID=218467 RepID=UPI000C6CE014|nr:patched domain-containing protein 3-like [Centruroides sculpturatus]
MKIHYDIIQIKLSSCLEKLGKAIGYKPAPFVIIPIIISVIFGTGIIRMNYDREFIKLFSSETSKSVKNKNIVESLFPINTSKNFDIFRSTKDSGGLFFLVISNEESLLTEFAFNELETIDKIINNFTIICNDQIIYYRNICAKYIDCFENPIFKLKPKIKDFEQGKYKVKYPIDVDVFTYAYTRYIVNLGGVTVDENRYLKTAKAVRLIYPFDDDNITKVDCIKKFEEKFLAYINEMKFQYITVSAEGKWSLISEIIEFTKRLFPLTSVVFFTVLLFSTLTCMTNSWIRSKPWLGVASCVSALLSTVTSFGFLFYCGMKNIDINVTLPYLILAIEIDDAYVLISAWRRTSARMKVYDRMGETFKKAAVSVTITTLTSLLSFCIGITISFPAIRTFCIFASLSIFVNYIYQITFFGGWMAISGLREEHNLNPFTLRKVKGYDNLQLKDEEEEEDPMAKIFKHKIGEFICLKPTKIFIIIISIINFSVGIWSMKYLVIGMELTNFFKSDSNVTSLIENTYKHFTEYPFPINIVINKQLDFSNKTIQESVENMLKKFESHPHTSDEFITLSWLKYYKIFINSPVSIFSLNHYDLSKKQDFIDGLRNVFLNIPSARQFRDDIIFNDNFTEIIASRYIIACKNIVNRQIELQLFKDIQTIAKQSEIPVLLHSFTFPLLEHVLLIQDIVFQLAWVLSIIAIVILFIFLPNIISVICISFVIVASLCETIGYMSLWNVHLDMISVILLILSSGFSINYPTHVSFAFMLTKNKNPNERIKESLYEVGWPILQGSISTILGVVILAFQSNYVFGVFFKIVFLITIETAFNAMFLLPVILSFVSNWYCKDSINQSSKK